MGSNMTEDAVKKIIFSKQELRYIPVIANVNVGHVQPIATIPYGGRATITARGSKTSFIIEQN
jgi:muramoyltetrapeptide carboxypeptidase LdcA involved in peptidoglycan recycling